MKFASGLLILLALSGCTYTANPWPMKPDMLTPFESTSAIKILNTSATEKAPIYGTGIKTDLHQTTEATINLLKSELSKSGLNFDEESTKTIEISLKSLASVNYFVALGCDMTYQVETGDGYSKEIKVHNKSGLSLNLACDFAITKAVADIINDEQIRSYIGTSINNKL